jgi:hypothetical protein
MSDILIPTHRAVAILDLPLKVPALILYAQNIVKAMTGNPAFPTPAPTLAALTAAIAALNAAEMATLTRLKGTVSARNTARGALVLLLQQLKGYIQNTADADLANGAPMIESAGVGVRKTPVRPPRVFNATPGPTSGSAKLVTPAAAHRASYEWETSTDGGKTWVTAPPTMQARTTVTGLPSGTSVQFRVRAVTKDGAGDWSAPVSLLVK